MPFEVLVALRFLREGRVQTLLILLGIGVGVGVIVFLSALITGLQANLIGTTLGTQPHIVLRPPDEEARPQLPRPEGGDAGDAGDGRGGSHGPTIVEQIQRPAQRLRSIMGWQQQLAAVRTIPGVRAASPIVAGAAFALRGTANKSIALRGVDPDTYRDVIDLRPKLVAGTFDVSGTNVVVGIELAKELGLGLGDKVRIETPLDRADAFTVRGLLDVGNRDLNLRWVFVSLRSAQTLLDISGGVSTIECRVERIFDAAAIAGRAAAETGLVADSWMKLNAQLLVGLRSQSSSSYMIQFFVIVAVALGIASVLVVSVVQKSREIGILRAFGTSRGQIRRVFLLQGGLLGLAGSLCGMGLGVLLAVFFQSLARNADGSPTFPVALDATLLIRSALVAIVTGLLGAWLPARRAAALDPATAIRHE